MALGRVKDWIRRSGDMPAHLAFRLANVAPFDRMLDQRYGRALADHSNALPQLAGLDRDIVAGLERDGVFVTSMEALSVPGSAQVLRDAQVLGDAFAEEARRRVRRGIDFNIVPGSSIMTKPAIFSWGVQDRLLDIVETYLGLPVAYDGMHIIYTVADGREAASRLWHRDREDRRMLKIAVYCNDVDERGGPFQLIRRAGQVLCDAVGTPFAEVSDEQLATMLGADYRKDLVSCVGPAGTVVFADTARFLHRGQPAITQDRKAMFYSYFARPPRHPFYCERSGLTRAQIAKLAAAMTPRQQACTLWRDALPPLARMIPTVKM